MKAMKARNIAGGIPARILSQYGIIGVLILLCLYYSLATIAEQHPSGESAADSLASEIVSISSPSTSVLIVGKRTEDDIKFVSSLSELLKIHRYSVVTTTLGDPAEIRRFLTSLYDKGEHYQIVAVTQGYKNILSNMIRKFDISRDATILIPKSYTWPTFLLPSNLMNIANQIAVIAVIAIGMTMVIITGGIDLSVGSLVAFSAVIAAGFIQRFGAIKAGTLVMLIASLGAITVCGLVGAFSGLMVTRFKLPPFIATLGIMQVASGFAYIFSEGKPIYKIPDSVTTLGRGIDPLFSIPYAVILMVFLYIVAHILMSKTVLGRYIYAIGGNIEAARLSGIRVNSVLIFVYITSGVMAGLGGIITMSQLKSGAPTYGLLYELYVIAAVVVGGTSLSGGEGRIFGTLIGAFIIAVIQNGMNLTNVESYTQKVILGLVILGAVLLDKLKKSRMDAA